MKPGLLILPFLAILVAAIGMAAGSALPEIGWVPALAWGTALVVLALWVTLDLDNFKAMFRRKGAKYGASSGLAIVFGVTSIVGVAVIAARPRFNKSIDVTRDKLNTLSDQSTKVIASIKSSGAPVKVEVYASDEKVNADLRDLFGLYQSKGASLQVEYIDPQTHPTQAMAAKVTEGNTVIFRHGKQEKRLSAFTEEKITNALVNVLKDKSKKIYFIKGHGEGALKGAEATGFNSVAMDLESNRNSVEELSLLETAKVPEDADMIVVAGPKYEFKEEETRIIEDYLKRGGSMLTMVGAMTPVLQLNKLLGKFGVQYNQDLLILAPNDVRAQMIGQNNAIISEFDEFSPVTKDYARVSQVQMVMRNTRSLSEVNDNAQKLKVTLAAKTSKEIIRVKNVSSPADLENLQEDRWEAGSFPVVAVAAGKSTLLPTAAASTAAKDAKSDAGKGDLGGGKGRESRLVSVGSVEFANNQGAQLAENKDMFANMINYLLQDEDFIAIRPKDPTKSTINLTTRSSQAALTFLVLIYPFLFMGGGTVAWLRRRRA